MLQFITHRTALLDETAGAEAALKGGCRWIQLRMKGADTDSIVAKGREIARMCRSYGAKLIIDDHVGLVAEIGADGVHVGKNDMPVDEARRLLGPDRIIGATANTLDDIVRATAAGADYIGLGPFRFTETKKNLSPVLGLDGYRSIMKRCRGLGRQLPVVAIGGITSADIAALMTTGISGIAMSGSILGAEDPVGMTETIINLINGAK